MDLKKRLTPVEVEFRSHGFGLLESHHDKGFSMEWRSDPFPKILMFIGGDGVLETDDRKIAIQAPVTCVVPRDVTHRLIDSRKNPLSLYGVCLKSPVFPRPEIVESVCGELRIEQNLRPTQRIEKWLRQLLAEERLQPIGFEDAQQCIVTWILLELARARKRESSKFVDSHFRVESYIESLNTEFWKTENIDSVARTLGLGRRRFTQLFREISGEAWQKRSTRLRIEYAAKLLRSTQLSVRSIAFECGYHDLSHFYRSFKTNYECSPAVYRSTSDAD